MKKAIKRMMGSEGSYLKFVRREKLNQDMTRGLEFWDEETELERRYKNRLAKACKNDYSWEEACYG